MPAGRLSGMQDCAARVLRFDPVAGSLLTLDGEPIDAEPAARLASPAQRTALVVRDRHCTEGGVTRLENMTLLCSGHHVLRHHPAHHLAA